MSYSVVLRYWFLSRLRACSGRCFQVDHDVNNFNLDLILNCNSSGMAGVYLVFGCINNDYSRQSIYSRNEIKKRKEILLHNLKIRWQNSQSRTVFSRAYIHSTGFGVKLVRKKIKNRLRPKISIIFGSPTKIKKLIKTGK